MISAIIIVQLLFGLTCFSAQPTPSAESPLQLSSKNTTKTSLYYDQRQTGKYNINVNIKDVAIISLEPENLSSNIGDSGGDFYEDYYDYDVDDFTISPISALLGGGTPRPPTTAKPIQSSEIITTPSSLPSALASASITTPTEPAADSLATSSSSSSPKPLHHQNVIIMNEVPIAMPAVISQPLPQLQADEIPVQVIMEPLLKPRIRPAAMNRLANHRSTSASAHDSSDGSKVVRMRSRNSVATNCHRGQSRDRNGRCRSRRSGLRRVMDLLTMLAPKEQDQ